MNQKSARHLVAQIRGLPMPKIPAVVVPVGGDAEADWSEWLVARGYPALGVIGHAVSGGWLMPVVRAPREQDELAHRVAVTWANWLRSKPGNF